MCGIHNQNFAWDLKILWEPGSQVPRDSPALGVWTGSKYERVLKSDAIKKGGEGGGVSLEMV